MVKISSDKQLFHEFKNIFEDKIEVLEYDEFCSFLDEVKGKEDALAIAEKYTTDINSLVDLIMLVMPSIQTRSLKERLKRLVKNIQKQRRKNNEHVTTPDFSQTSAIDSETSDI